MEIIWMERNPKIVRFPGGRDDERLILFSFKYSGIVSAVTSLSHSFLPSSSLFPFPSFFPHVQVKALWEILVWKTDSVIDCYTSKQALKFNRLIRKASRCPTSAFPFLFPLFFCVAEAAVVQQPRPSRTMLLERKERRRVPKLCEGLWQTRPRSLFNVRNKRIQAPLQTIYN